MGKFDRIEHLPDGSVEINDTPVLVGDTSQAVEPTANLAFRGLTSIADRQLITVSNSSQQGFGIATSAYHISGDPDQIGGLEGESMDLIQDSPVDLYIVGASSDGPGGPGIEHNGTVNGLHLRVTFDGTGQLIEEVVEYIRHHPGPGDWATRTFNSIPKTNVNLLDSNFSLLYDFVFSTGSIDPAPQTAQLNYQDIGNTRIQWGSQTEDGIVTLPVPFANSAYSVTTANTFPSGQRSSQVIENTKTTTQFEIRAFAGSAASATGSNWVAIGVKP